MWGAGRQAPGSLPCGPADHGWPACCTRHCPGLQAAARCALLSPPAQLASNMRQLFHASTRKYANTGCLLEQVATHIVLGLGLAVEACTKALLGPFRPQQLLDQEAAAAATAAGSAGSASPAGMSGGGSGQAQGPRAPAHGGSPGAGAGAGAPAGSPSARVARQLSRQTLQRAAQLAVAASAGRVLQAVSTVGAVVSVLQQHCQRVLSPHLGPPGGAEARACAGGLAALVKAVDERVLGALQRCLSQLLSQADMTLVAEQRREDFCPGEASPPPSLDEPTPACVAVCGLLGAAVDAAQQHLHGPNLASFLGEVGCVAWAGLVAAADLECHRQANAVPGSSAALCGHGGVVGEPDWSRYAGSRHAGSRYAGPCWAGLRQHLACACPPIHPACPPAGLAISPATLVCVPALPCASPCPALPHPSLPHCRACCTPRLPPLSPTLCSWAAAPA